MRLEVDGGEIRPRPLNNELLDAEFEGQEIRKKDIFAFYNLDVKKDKLSLEQGQYIMERRLQELQFVLSPSQKSTPRDGYLETDIILVPAFKESGGNKTLGFTIIRY